MTVCTLPAPCLLHQSPRYAPYGSLLQHPHLWPACTLWGEGDTPEATLQMIQRVVAPHLGVAPLEISQHPDVCCVTGGGLSREQETAPTTFSSVSAATAARYGQRLSRETMSEVQALCRTPPLVASFRWLILAHAEDISLACQHSLLKLCEEPPPYLRILMMATNPARLSATLRARFFPIRWPACGLSSVVLTEQGHTFSFPEGSADPILLRTWCGLILGALGYGAPPAPCVSWFVSEHHDMWQDVVLRVIHQLMVVAPHTHHATLLAELYLSLAHLRDDAQVMNLDPLSVTTSQWEKLKQHAVSVADYQKAHDPQDAVL